MSANLLSQRRESAAAAAPELQAAGTAAAELPDWSILQPRGRAARSPEAPECFRDLNLEQVVEWIAGLRKDYDLAPIFHAPLREVDDVRYRQEVMRDLESEGTMRAVSAFSERMRDMRNELVAAEKSPYRRPGARLFLHAAESYCAAVDGLLAALSATGAASRGLSEFRRYLAGYAATARYRELSAAATALRSRLAAIQYCVHIYDGGVVGVRACADEDDYSALVERTFERFRRSPAKDYRQKYPEGAGVNHIHDRVLEGVARLFPGQFRELDAFQASWRGFPDETIVRFEMEVQFYTAYFEYIAPLRRAGLPFCLPAISENSKSVSATQTFDLALARKLDGRVVCNDFFLRGPERIFVVSGPNQGGKTTFARCFGQLHYLASLGCPVPGARAQLFLFDRLFTHFERQEDVRNLRGKLQDELLRMRWIFERATPRSLLIVNEMFASTSLDDALALGRKVLARMSTLDLLGVCVTFLDELASFDAKTVSVLSTVDPANPAKRTFRIERRPADGLAYARAIAEKYRLTYESLKARIRE